MGIYRVTRVANSSYRGIHKLHRLLYLMQSTNIGFAYSGTEVRSLLEYCKKKNLTDISIFTPSIDGQLELQRQGLSHLDYHHLQFHSKQTAKELEIIYRKTQKTIKHIRKHLSQVRIADVGLVDVLQIVLETEFVEVFFAYELWKILEKEYRPKKYLVASNLSTTLSGWHADYFSHAAILAGFFIPQDKLVRFPTTTLLDSSWKKSIWNTIYWLSQLKNISDISQKIWYDFLALRIDLPHTPAFLWFSGGYNLYYYHQLVKLFHQENWLNKGIIVTDRQSLADELLLRKANIPFVPLTHYQNQIQVKKAEQEILRVKKELKELLSASTSTELFPTELTSLLKNALNFKLKLVCDHYLSRTIKRILVAQSIIRSQKPKLLITTHDPGPSALPFVYAAKQRSISSLVLLHGLHQSSFSTNYESDQAVVWGQKMQKWYVNELGKSQNLVHPLGFPFLDDLFRKYSQSNLFLNRLKLSAPIKVGVLVAFYVPTFGIAGYLDELFRAAAKYKDKFLLHIRSHPGQQIPGGEELASLYSLQVVYNQKMNIDEFCRVQDVIITWDTTAMVWAMIHKKPLFFAPPWWGSGQIPVGRYNAAWIPQNATELVKSILNLPQNQTSYDKQLLGQRRFLKEYIGSVSGNATTLYLKFLQKYIS